MLPSIPISPLIQQSLKCASELAQLTEKIANQQQEEIEYYEQQSISQRIKLDLITKQMYSVRELLFHHWQPEALAKQIAIINVDLFLHHDVKQLNNFHTYLLHSLAHQIIISNRSYETFDFAVRLARCLQQYRDWNGCMGVLRCLSLPSIQNLSPTSVFTHNFPWMEQDIDSSYLKAFQHSLLPLRPYSLDSQEQKRSRPLYTSSFYTRKRKDTFVIAVPWFSPLLESISEQDKALYMDICRYNQWPKQPNVTKILFHLDNDSASSSSSTIPSILPSSSIFDLSTSLGQGDLLICHWLLSRAFLTLDQLNLESEIIKSTNVENQEQEQVTFHIATIKYGIDNEESQQQYQNQGEEESVKIVEQEDTKQQYDSETADVIKSKASGGINEAPSPNLTLLNIDIDINNNSGHDKINSRNNDNDDVINNADYDDNSDDNNNNNNDNNDDIVNDGNNSNDSCKDSIKSSSSKNDNSNDLHENNDSLVASDNKINEMSISLDSISTPINNDSTEVAYHNKVNHTIYPLNNVKDDNSNDNKEQHSHLLNDISANSNSNDNGVNNNNDDDNNNNDDDNNNKDIDDSSNIKEVINESYTQLDKPIDIFSPEQTSKPLSKLQKESIFNNTVQSVNEESLNYEDEIVYESNENNDKDKIEDKNDNASNVIEDINSNIQNIKENNNNNSNIKENEEKPEKENDDNASEQWTGYPMPEVEMEDICQGANAEDEIWTGYPEPHQTVSSDEASEEEWKGYHATSEETKWQEETILKVQQQEWIGYTLETLDEDELDSSTVISNRYDKPYQSTKTLLNNQIQSSS